MKTVGFNNSLTRLATLAITLIACGPASWAQAVQSVYSPVIIFYDSVHMYAGQDTARGWLQMHEDGKGLSQLASGGNLSYVGGAGGRYFLLPRTDAAVTFSDGSRYADCVAWHENGDPSTLRVLTSDHALWREDCQWSADGEHVVYNGRRFDNSGSVVESGAFLGDVEWAGGEPVRVYNERLIASHQPSDGLYVTGFHVDARGERIAFKLQHEFLDGQGRTIRETFGLFVAPVMPAVEGAPMPPPAIPVRIRLSTPDAERGCCAFSPVLGDYRVLYTERAPSKWPYINYFWTVDVPVQYDGSYALVPIQVTTKANSPANYLHATAWTPNFWSPTGSHIAFIASRNADWTATHVYKISADGKGKAIRLTADQDGYGGLRWRP